MRTKEDSNDKEFSNRDRDRDRDRERDRDYDRPDRRDRDRRDRDRDRDRRESGEFFSRVDLLEEKISALNLV